MSVGQANSIHHSIAHHRHLTTRERYVQSITVDYISLINRNSPTDPATPPDAPTCPSSTSPPTPARRRTSCSG